MPNSALNYAQRLRESSGDSTSLICAICEEIISDPSIHGDHGELARVAAALRSVRTSNTIASRHVSVDGAIAKIAGLIRERTPRGAIVRER